MAADGVVDQLSWPPIPVPYLGALRRCVEYVLDRFDDVAGIIAAGSIIRGAPHASSDLDVYVIRSLAVRLRIQKYFSGIPAEIFVNPPSSIERYLDEECSRGRPLTAHMLATGHVVLARDPVVEELRLRARRLIAFPPPFSIEPTYSRYLVSTMFEDAVDVRAQDEATALLILNAAVDAALRHLFLVRGRYVPRTKELLSECSRLDPRIGALAASYFGERSLSERFEIAGEIVVSVSGARGFFEWESHAENVGEGTES